jgi:hypothetical protein
VEILDKKVEFIESTEKLDAYTALEHTKSLLNNPIYMRGIRSIEARLIDEIRTCEHSDLLKVRLKLDALTTVDSYFRTVVAEAEFEYEQKMKGDSNG